MGIRLNAIWYIRWADATAVSADSRGTTKEQVLPTWRRSETKAIRPLDAGRHNGNGMRSPWRLATTAGMDRHVLRGTCRERDRLLFHVTDEAAD